MAKAFETRRVRVLRVHCPIEAATLAAMLNGSPAAIERDPVLGRMLPIIRGGGPLGDFGIYRGVVELAPGWELFTPGADAAPVAGSAGSDTISPTAILTVHIPADADPDAVDTALAAVMAAHPWEVPVIELGETALLVRA